MTVTSPAPLTEDVLLSLVEAAARNVLTNRALLLAVAQARTAGLTEDQIVRATGGAHRAHLWGSLGALHVELHTTDFPATLAFWTGLGFAPVWYHPAPGHAGYLVLQMGPRIICYWPGNESVTENPQFGSLPSDSPRGYGVEIVLTVPDLPAFYEKVLAAGAVVQTMRTHPCGLLDFRFLDPTGYYFRVNEDHDPTVPRPADGDR